MSVPTLTDEQLMVFVEEVEFQCALAIRAFRNMRKHYDPDMGKAEIVEHDHFYGFSVISHVGNISKLFWSSRRKNDPMRPITLVRCEQLRMALDVDDKWLIAGRETRDYLEHYDERLEDWLHTPSHKPRADLMLENRLVLSRDNGEVYEGRKLPSRDKDYHRTYDYSTNTIYVANLGYDLSDVIHEVSNLKERAEKWLVDRGLWAELEDDTSS